MIADWRVITSLFYVVFGIGIKIVTFSGPKQPKDQELEECDILGPVNACRHGEFGLL